MTGAELRGSIINLRFSPKPAVIRIPVYNGHIQMAGTDPLEDCIGFDWDEGNTIKNCELHGVSPEEAEDVFFHELFVVHSKKEKRHYALAKTGSGSRLFVSFTIRRKLIRVISVRDMNRNEAELYGHYEKEEGS